MNNVVISEGSVRPRLTRKSSLGLPFPGELFGAHVLLLEMDAALAEPKSTDVAIAIEPLVVKH
jgi:hypothetical protein